MSGCTQLPDLCTAPPSSLLSGLPLLKLNKWKLPQSRFLWLDLDNCELRWSKNSRLASVVYKRVPFCEIEKVGKVSKYRQTKAEHGLTVDAAGKSYVFRTETLEIRDQLVQALTDLSRKEEPIALRSTRATISPGAYEDTENCGTPDQKPETVLCDFNKHEGLTCSRELFSKTGSAHRRAKYQDGAYRNIVTKITQTLSEVPNIETPDSPQELPATISKLLEGHNEEIKKLQEDLQRETQESCKVQALRKRLKMLEAAREKCEALEQENEQLKGKLEAQRQANQALEQQLIERFPKVVDSASALAASQEEVLAAGIDLLKRGFHGYVNCIGDEVALKQLELTPDSSEEEGYKHRHIQCSQDLAQLVWKPTSLFTNKRVFICISEISTVISGTEDPTTLQPFPDCDYLTLQCPQFTLILAVEAHYSFYLEAITTLFAQANDLPYTPASSTDGLLTRCRQACQQYEAQSRLLQHLIKTYKVTLTASICDLHNGFSAQQAVYSAEIAQLREVNEKCVQGLMSPEAQEYWRTERGQLLERLRYMNEVVASLQNAQKQLL